MQIWFEITAKYIKMDENGHEKKATETYLLDAVSFTEAEARIYKELQTMVSGEFMVTKIARTRITEIIPSESGDRWFKVKVSFITVNEESGKEKKVSQFILVFANTVEEADKATKEAMHGMMADFELSSVAESNIVDVFTYLEEKEIPANLKPIKEFLHEETVDTYYEETEVPKNIKVLSDLTGMVLAAEKCFDCANNGNKGCPDNVNECQDWELADDPEE